MSKGLTGEPPTDRPDAASRAHACTHARARVCARTRVCVRAHSRACTCAAWGAAILLLYRISHMWLTAHRRRMTDDPLVFAIKDRVSLVLIALTIVIAWFAV